MANNIYTGSKRPRALPRVWGPAVLIAIVELACALGVQSDDLLFDRGSERSRVLAELSDTLDRCTSQQLRILTDIVKAAKISLDKYQQP